MHKSFGRTPIISGVDLAIAQGERHAIIGPNGAGKSTLFNLISGRFPRQPGQILLNGEDITGLEAQEINRRGLSRSFQITNIFPRLSVYENLRCAVLWSLGYRYSFWHASARCRTCASAPRRSSSKIGLIAAARSPGRRADLRRAARARDRHHHRRRRRRDPARRADRRHEPQRDARFVELIRKVTQGKTLVMVEHDMGVVFGLADRISVLVYGE